MESRSFLDMKIEKEVLMPGEFGSKPYNNSECTINILDCPEILAQYNNVKLVVGNIGGDLGRLLDIVLCMMHLNERSKFVISDLNLTFICELVEFKFNGYIYEWDAKYKCDLALKRKENGIKMFNDNNYKEAAYMFTKALKLVLSIPIDVEFPPNNIDGVALSDIQTLKANLYNNLSSCYLKKHMYPCVIDLCKKVLIFDSKNVKALYKLGVAYEADKDFENAYEALSRALEIDPSNKTCIEHLTNVKLRLKESEIRTNEMMKKMIGGSLRD